MGLIDHLGKILILKPPKQKEKIKFWKCRNWCKKIYLSRTFKPQDSWDFGIIIQSPAQNLEIAKWVWCWGMSGVGGYEVLFKDIQIMCAFAVSKFGNGIVSSIRSWFSSFRPSWRSWSPLETFIVGLFYANGFSGIKKQKKLFLIIWELD